MSSEQSNQKSKTIGKVIVVILCCAILLFLLLPFLDGSAKSAASKSNGKRTLPQIFTANPLAETASRILSAFNRKSKRNPFDSVLKTPSQEEQQLLATRTPNRARKNKLTGKSSQSEIASSSEQDASDGILAAFLNEDGEWVLVNQTEPDSSNRGMHDINSSDSAYDKLLRLERQAKWTGHAADTPTENPSHSSWEQIWQPIKQLFGGKEETATPDAFKLARAEKEPSASRAAQATAFPARAPELNINTGKRNSTSDSDNSSFTQQISSLLNPAQGFEELAASLRNTARETMSAKDYQNYTRSVKAEQMQKQLNQVYQTKLLQDAEGTEPIELVSSAYKCDIDPSKSRTFGLYGQNSCGRTGDLPTKEERDQSHRQADAAKQASMAVIDKAMSDLTSGQLHYTEPMKMVVVLQKAKAGNTENTQISEMEGEKAELFKKFYDYMYQQQGCDKQDCYLVGADYQPDPSLRDTVESGGFTYQGDPLHIYQNTFSRFLQEEINKSEEAADAAVDVFNDTHAVDQMTPYYIPYTQEQLASINTANDNPAEEVPTLFYVPSPANTADMQNVLPNLQWVVYDDAQSNILSQANQMDTNQQRGAQIRDKFIEKMQFAKQKKEEAQESITSQTVTAVVKSQQENIRQGMSDIASDIASELSHTRN